MVFVQVQVVETVTAALSASSGSSGVYIGGADGCILLLYFCISSNTAVHLRIAKPWFYCFGCEV